MVRFLTQKSHSALVLDDDRAAPTRGAFVHAFELARGQRVILDRDRQPPDCRVDRWALWNGPRAQYVTDLQAEVEMQCGRVVELDDEARHVFRAVHRPETTSVRGFESRRLASPSEHRRTNRGRSLGWEVTMRLRRLRALVMVSAIDRPRRDGVATVS